MSKKMLFLLLLYRDGFGLLKVRSFLNRFELDQFGRTVEVICVTPIYWNVTRTREAMNRLIDFIGNEVIQLYHASNELRTSERKPDGESKGE